MKKFNYSGYNVIVFDEIYLLSIKLLSMIRFCENNSNLIIIATGDLAQIPPIEPYTNAKDFKTYAEECIDNIFLIINI